MHAKVLRLDLLLAFEGFHDISSIID